MVSQLYPINFPFSVLDFGLTALALLVIGVMTYFFIRFLNKEREAREQNFKQMQDEMVKAMREIVVAAERHTEVNRGMMTEFYHMAEELAEMRKQFYISRDKMRELSEAFVTLESTARKQQEWRLERKVGGETQDEPNI